MCCDTGVVSLNLSHTNPSITNGMSQNTVSVIQTPTKHGNQPCSSQALLKVTFGLAQGHPHCGHYLRIDLDISKHYSTGAHWMLNIGDSESKNGWGGDGSHQNYDAELEMFDGHLRMQGNDHCRDPAFPLSFDKVMPRYKNASTVLTIFIGNEYIRITDGAGFDKEKQSHCLFALNNHSDITVNQDIYVAINRVVSSANYRDGFGICAANLSWVCGWQQ